MVAGLSSIDYSLLIAIYDLVGLESERDDGSYGAPEERQPRGAPAAAIGHSGQTEGKKLHDCKDGRCPLARESCNPRTGERIAIGPSAGVSSKADKALKGALN